MHYFISCSYHINKIHLCKLTKVALVNFSVYITFNLLLFLVCFQWNSVRTEILLTTSLYYKFSLIWQKTYLLMTNFPLSILSHPQWNGSSSLIFLASILALASCIYFPQGVHSTITASRPGLAFDINAQHDIPSKAHSSKWAPNGPVINNKRVPKCLK